MSTKTLLPIEFKDNKLILVDQRKLPHEEIYLEYTDLEGTFESIKTMVVRGAPCIGFSPEKYSIICSIFVSCKPINENNQKVNKIK